MNKLTAQRQCKLSTLLLFVSDLKKMAADLVMESDPYCNSVSIQLIETKLSSGQNKCHCSYCLVFSSAQLVINDTVHCPVNVDDKFLPIL